LRLAGNSFPKRESDSDDVFRCALISARKQGVNHLIRMVQRQNRNAAPIDFRRPGRHVATNDIASREIGIRME
jgi:hypothetical protein